MPAKKTSGGINAADIEEKLPKRYFVTRGHIADAFGFGRVELSELINIGVFAAKYPIGLKKRARFVRSQVIEVARTWNKPTG